VDPTLTRRREERLTAHRRTARRRGRILLVILVALAGLVAYSARQRLRSSPSAGALSIATYRAEASGDRRPAPQFEGPGLDGGTVSSGEFRGRVVVVNFWASWCGPCRQEAPALQRLWERYRDRGVQFLGINFRDDEAAAREYEREFGITFPSVVDPTGKLAFDFQVLALPSTFVVGRDGWIEYHFTGVITDELLRRAIEDLVEASP
jgi:DsbE subfamily thiol:disulfide oxidoreductase